MPPTWHQHEARSSGCTEQQVAAPQAQLLNRGRTSVIQLLAQVSEEHEREVGELRLHYEAQLSAVRQEFEEKENNIGSVGDVASTVNIVVGASSTCLPESSPTAERRVGQEAKDKDDFSEEHKGRSKSTIVRATNQIALLHNAEYRHTMTSFHHMFEHYVDIVATVIVMFHIVFLITQMQYSGQKVAEEAGIINSSPPSDDYAFVLEVLDHTFNGFFILEMLSRILILKRGFFLTEQGHWQWFNFADLVLVTSTSVDLYLTDSSILNFNAFRPVIRFFRLLRMMRVMKLVKFFFKLRVLVFTVAASFMALFWSIVLLVITMLMAALMLNQFLVAEMLSENISLTQRVWIYQMYGTSLRAFYTVFELTFSGGWPTYARPLVEEVSPWWAVFFFVYIISVVFAMFRIITALFLRDTLALAADDAETAIQEKQHQKLSTAKKLREFFEVADLSGDGMLSLDEFEEMLEVPSVCTWLSLLEIDVHGAKELFSLLKDANGNLSVDDFVEGMMRIKGQAKSQEVHEILIKHKRMCEVMVMVHQRLDSIDMSMQRVPRTSQTQI